MANVKTYLDPISRIEGHLGANITSPSGAGGYVTEADVHGNLWRGFENFLIGREANDAITFTQRICGVCPVPHGMTSTFAVEAAFGYNSNFQTYMMTGPSSDGVPPKALHIRNLILGAEFLMSSITHFYHLAAPSYVQGPNVPPWTPYFADSYYHALLLSSSGGSGDLTTYPAAGGVYSTLPTVEAGSGAYSDSLWSAVIRSYVHALRIRRLTFEAGAMFAGRMPMTSSYVAGGVTVPREEDLTGKCALFQKFMVEIGQFIVTEYVPIALALGALYPNFDNLANANITTAVSVGANTLWQLGDKTGSSAPSAVNTGFGAGVGRFLAWGGFPQANDTLYAPGGTAVVSGASITTGSIVAARGDAAAGTTKVASSLFEDVQHSRYVANTAWGYASGATTGYPGSITRTEPLRDTTTAVTGTDKYSWIKSPRWGGKSMEVGPLARLVVAGKYPADGTSFAGSSISGTYLLYTKAVTAAITGTGGTIPTGTYLDPQMVAPDLAVALLRAGLAEFYAADGTHVATGTAVNAIAGTPGFATTYFGGYIGGIIAAWVVGLSGGLSTMDRLRARAIESLLLITAMIGGVSKTGSGVTFGPGDITSGNASSCGWLGKLYVLPEYGSSGSGANGTARTTGYTSWTFNPSMPYLGGNSSGFGTTEAPRGALAHFISISGGRITAYQCVVPTTWNGSPKDLAFDSAVTDADKALHRGPIEQAMVGSWRAANTDVNAVEQLRIAQSFDPCIACAVH